MKLSITDRLLGWYNPDLRELPWKLTRDPYKIWLSEIILQQTRVQQGKPYYLKFIEHFPDIGSLAAAEQDEVMKLWEGLGYYSRARNLHEAAKQVVKQLDGVFPLDYFSLLRLKGVGEYTAAAVASFAYDEPVAVVDGNVFRFLSRLFGIADPIDTTAGKKKFKQLAADILNREDPATHNQAIMDFGALVCSPRKPDCSICPFRIDCVAFNEDRIGTLPQKSKSPGKRERVFTFYILRDRERIIIQCRTDKDIWQGLYQFPLQENEDVKDKDGSDFPGSSLIAELLKKAGRITTYQWYKQVLSHQRINAKFVIAELEDLDHIPMQKDWKIIPARELFSYAYPRIIRTFLDEHNDWLPNSHTLRAGL